MTAGGGKRFAPIRRPEGHPVRHLLEAVRQSVRENNWYAALVGALTLPDVAAHLDQRPRGRGRYISWFNDYLLPHYTTVRAGGESLVFLSGEDCYALRCAFLHSAEFDIDYQGALNRFIFLEPEKTRCHLNWFSTPTGEVLQLQVSRFCEEVCEAVERWMAARATDPLVAGALAGLPLIHLTLDPLP